MDKTTGEPTADYWAWRKKGTNNPFAVRYRNEFDGRKSCICSIWHDNVRLDCIQARKAIYCAEYARLARQTGAFKKLLALLASGKNLQLLEVDGPDPTLTFAPYDQISKGKPGLVMTEDVVTMLVNDPRKPLGHGFTIAALLLDGAEWMK